MKKGVVIGIIIAVIIIGTISTYAVINQNLNAANKITLPDTQTSTGVNHSIELTEGITMTTPSP